MADRHRPQRCAGCCTASLGPRRSCASLGEELANAGWRCHGPLLAGHGTTPEDLARTRWEDWAASAEEALAALRSECDEVVVAGQSGGGSLALHLAAHHPAIARGRLPRHPGLAHRLEAPAAARRQARGALGPAPRRRRPLPDARASRSCGPTAAARPARSTSSHACSPMCVTSWSSVRAPVLICHGERDRVIDPANAAEIERRLLCSGAVERHMLPRSGHGISVDIDRDAGQPDRYRLV